MSMEEYLAETCPGEDSVFSLAYRERSSSDEREKIHKSFSCEPELHQVWCSDRGPRSYFQGMSACSNSLTGVFHGASSSAINNEFSTMVCGHNYSGSASFAGSDFVVVVEVEEQCSFSIQNLGVSAMLCGRL